MSKVAHKINTTFSCNSKKKNFSLLFVIVLFCVSLFIVLSSIGKVIQSPFSLKTDWNNIDYIDCANHFVQDNNNSNSEYSLVIDDYSKRISVLDKNWKIRAQNVITSNSMPIDFVSSAKIYEDNIYLAGTDIDEDGININDQKIVRCSTYAEYKETIFSLKSLGIENSKQNAHVSNIDVLNNDIYFSLINDNNIEVYKIRWDDDKYITEKLSNVKIDLKPINANYSAVQNKIVIMDGNSNVYVYNCSNNSLFKIDVGNHIAQYLVFSTNGNVIFKDILDSRIYEIDRNNQQISQYQYYFDQENEFKKINNIESNLHIDSCGNVIKISNSADFTLLRSFSIIVKWIAFLYIVIVVLVAVILFLKGQKKNLKKGLLKRSIVVVIIFITLIGSACFFSYVLYSYTVNDTYDKTSILADNASKIIKNKIQENNLNVHLQNNIDSYSHTQENFSEINKFSEKIDAPLNDLLKSSESGNFPVFYDVYGFNKSSSTFYFLTDSKQEALPMSKTFIEEEKISELLNNGDLQNIYEDIRGKFLYTAKLITLDNGDIVGAVIFSKYIKNIETSFFKNAGIWSLILLSIALLLMVFIRELEFLAKQFSVYFKKKRKQKKRAFIQLVRPLNFFLSLSFSADAVLAAIISKDLFVKSDIYLNFANQNIDNLFAGIPITVAALSLVLGIALFYKLEKFFTARFMFLFSNIGLIVGMCITIWACSKYSFISFTLAKMLTGFFIGVLQAELYSMAVLEKDEDKRHSLVSSIGRTKMPASIISAIICGYCAQHFDYSYVYNFAAVCAFLLFIFGLLVIPKNKFLVKKGVRSINNVFTLDYIKNSSKIFNLGRNDSYSSVDDNDLNDFKYKKSNKKLSKKEILKWLLSPQIIVLILFVFVPYTATQGYKSYLFPLYSSSMGIDKNIISIIYSLATAFGFIAVLPLSSFANKYDRWTRVIGSLFALGFIFVLFVANSRIDWAIIVMFLSITILKLFGTASRMLWMRHCKYHNLDILQLQPIMFFIEEVCKALQVVVFSIFLFVGGNQACFMFGVFCIISAIIFAVVSYKSPMRKKYIEQDNNKIK